MPFPSGTRREILDRLQRRERTASGLAGELAMTGAAVRQHLGTLRSIGLVERRKAEGGPGRPTYVYRLTDLGRAAFPKRYDLLLAELVAALVERHGSEAALEVVEGAAGRLARRVEGTFAELDPDARWDALLAWLEEEFSWEASVERTDGGRRIVLHHCPFLAVSGERPEVCGRFFIALVERLTGGARVTHVPIRDGFRCCALEVEEG